MDNCERYQVQEDKWYKIASLNRAKNGVAACTFDQMHLYAFGGWNGKQAFNDIEQYNIA